MIKVFKKWCNKHRIAIQYLENNIFKIDGIGSFLLVEPKDRVEDGESYSYEESEDGEYIIDIGSNIELILTDFEKELSVDFFVFQFGSKFYYTKSVNEVSFNDFLYLGQSQIDIELDYTHLGVHGGYEILNGSRSYADWVKKAKFIGSKSLGICEKNTLAGVLDFQFTCKKNGIKSIIGETVTVHLDDEVYFLKLYVQNEIGWRNLLRINMFISVTNQTPYIDESDLFENSEGLICVIPCNIELNKHVIKKFKTHFENLYYQIDVAEYSSDEIDYKVLSNLSIYFNNYMDRIQPVLLNDSYYLEESDADTKKMLNSFRSSATNFEFGSKDQYFKTLLDSFKKLTNLFPEDKKFFGNDFTDIFSTMVENTQEIDGLCNFQYKIDGFKLPDFEFEGLDSEYLIFQDFEDKNDRLFDYLIDKGLKAYGFDKNQEYLDRVEMEKEVIKGAGFTSYFLITWDIINFCNKNNILTGIGRGSACGSLISYLIGVTKIDPIPYGLLFERFLNKGRVKNSLPDIDNDFESARREEVKRYIESKYGVDNVASVGSYNTYQVKSAFQDICRVNGIPADKADYFSKLLDESFDERYVGADIKYYIITAHRNEEFFDLIQEYPQIVEYAKLIIKQASSASIHPCALIISPKKDKDGNPMTIFDWMPIRRDRVSGMMVTEWTGEVLADIGFLKQDILGIKQLDKFKKIFDLVKENTGEELTYESIKTNDEDVMTYFQKGYSQDVFQFGTSGLIEYTKKVQPSTVEELIAINALYRPGAMDSGFHNDYVNIKFGRKEVEYDLHLEEVEKETYGLLLYQEQIMSTFTILGGFSTATADDVRRAMGKKDLSKMIGYKDVFIQGAISKGYTEEKGNALWEKLVKFSEYGFNKSHAAAYAMTGYYCQWLKYYHPVEFYTTALKYSNDDYTTFILNEINKTGAITISPPDINSATDDFISDRGNKVIYWSLTKIKWVGEVATQCIVEERIKNGNFFSFEEFLGRVEKSKVNSRVVTNLIIAGAFDNIEGIKKVVDRGRIIKKYFDIIKKEMDEEEFPKDIIFKEYFWVLKQKDLTGLGDIDYHKIIKSSKIKHDIILNERTFYDDDHNPKKTIIVAGILTNVITRKARNNAENIFGVMTLNINDIEINITCWNQVYEKYRKDLAKHKGGIIVFSGNAKYDDFKQKNAIYSDFNSEIFFV